jgi:hypothetical protein
MQTRDRKILFGFLASVAPVLQDAMDDAEAPAFTDAKRGGMADHIFKAGKLIRKSASKRRRCRKTETTVAAALAAAQEIYEEAAAAVVNQEEEEDWVVIGKRSKTKNPAPEAATVTPIDHVADPVVQLVFGFLRGKDITPVLFTSRRFLELYKPSMPNYRYWNLRSLEVGLGDG